MRTDFDPRHTGRSALLEVGSLGLQTLLFGFGFLPHGHQPVRDRDLHTVVFVHGLAANRASLFPVQAWLRARGHRRQFSVNLASTGSIESMALRLKRRIDDEIKGGRIDLVCHSMGGLIARVWLQQLGGDRRVSRVVTLGTPHHGSHASAWIPSRLVRQMTPGSAFLTHLNRLPAPDVEFTSVSAGSDLIVLPADSALAPFGEHLRVEGAGHTGLLMAPRALRRVSAALGPSEESLRRIPMAPRLQAP